MSDGPDRVTSSIDAIGNAVLIAGLEQGEAGYIFRPGRYPLRLLPSVLHEAAHFDSYSTPVGVALATLYLRAWKGARTAGQGRGKTGGDRDSGYDALVDDIRFRTAEAVLRPFTEGIAVFCEFDARPGSSPITTSAPMLASACFCDADAPDAGEKTVAEIVASLLGGMRQSELFQARKENLISQPFGVAAGGYISGYYLVKNLRHILITYKGLSRLLDGDLYLFCLNAIVFGDLELARLLLDPSLDLMFSADPESVRRDAVNAVLSRIQQRMSALFTQMDEAFVNRVEAVVTRGGPWRWDQLQTDLTDERVRENIQIVEDAIDEVCRVPAAGDADENHEAASCARILANRRLLCLASYETAIDVNGKGRCNVGSFAKMGELTIPFLSTGALEGVVPQKGIGTFEIYFDRSTESRLLFSVVLGDAVVACGAINPETIVDKDELVSRCPSMRKMAAQRALMEQDLKRLREGELGRIVATHYLDQLPDIVKGIYHERVGALMEEGLGGVYPGDGVSLLDISGDQTDILSDYSRLSLYGGGLFVPGEMDAVCAALDIDPVEFRRQIALWQERTRFPLMTEKAGALSMLHL